MDDFEHSNVDDKILEDLTPNHIEDLTANMPAPSNCDQRGIYSFILYLLFILLIYVIKILFDY